MDILYLDTFQIVQILIWDLLVTSCQTPHSALLHVGLKSSAPSGHLRNIGKLLNQSKAILNCKNRGKAKIK
ncbi:hypothetical protein Barb7_01157 [Bacteroidales bacterium Barb7]|nr:hypothetical protein Barb7_01157 [Bacteroidales bacterium Barb7]